MHSVARPPVFAALAPRHFKAMARSGQSRTRRPLFDDLRARLHEHRLPIYASAIAYRALVSLIPLWLLGLGLLGALGLKDTWKDSIAPAIEPHVTQPVFRAIDYSAEKILTTGTAGVILFATALVVWDLAIGVSAIMDALNRIHDVEESRSVGRRVATAAALAVAVAVCLVGAALVVTVAPRAGGSLHFLLGVGRWLAAPLLLALAVGLLVHVGPAEHPEARWASVGSVFVIGSWIVASLLFKLWISHVSNFKSAIGSLTGLLVLTTYVFVSAAIFLIGAELDELLRKQAHGRHLNVFQLLRRA
jgi:membrane protein